MLLLQVWGGVLNRARDIGRQTIAWFPEGDAALRDQMVRPNAFEVFFKSLACTCF